MNKYTTEIDTDLRNNLKFIVFGIVWQTIYGRIPDWIEDIMKTISRMELQDGMEFAEPVEAAGKVIFNAGTKVTQSVISKLSH